MGALAKFVKDPDETKRYVITWEDWLDVDEKLSSVSFAVSIDSGPDDATLVVVDGYALTTDLLAVVFFVSSGQANVVYKIIATVHTTGGQIKEDAVLMSVRNT